MTFERIYTYDASEQTVTFAGRLRLAGSDETLTAETLHVPITPQRLCEGLAAAGFEEPEMLGDLTGKPFADRDNSVIAVAERTGN